jgi:hypothetical protein
LLDEKDKVEMEINKIVKGKEFPLDYLVIGGIAYGQSRTT